MGFGGGKGFTRQRTTWTGSGVIITPGGVWRFILARGKLISSKTLVCACLVAISHSTSGKLVTSKTLVVS